MIQFKKLRLAGFKSFVDQTELLINTGLTGVVGPNGCGKSNLVEALKWVMGETSAKQMRGGEMDDVIFAGSSNRPPRNVAEVAVVLDNSERTAPALFNNQEELHVLRRIERQKGSNYKVNGNEVRARDVQLLFADAATGARSTAMVSQGKIGTLINAKPQSRRIILEEAAGITGLHSRRHEAELRLKGAESNLARLDDILVTLEGQQNNLQKQARQAQRYRTISDRIRKAEALLYHLRWLNALESLDKARTNFNEIEKRVQDLSLRAAEASKVSAEASVHLPSLRQVEAEAAARLQRFKITYEQLAQEEARLDELKQDLLRRLEQAQQDIAREGDFSKDAETALARLKAEDEEIRLQGEDDELLREEALERLEHAKEDVALVDEKLSAETRALAEIDAQRKSQEQNKSALESRVQKLSLRNETLLQEKETLLSETIEEELLQQTQDQLEHLHEQLILIEEQITDSEDKRNEAQNQVQQCLHQFRETQSSLSKLEAEEDALVELLDPNHEQTTNQPVLDQISVTPGYEGALGAALGDDLSSPLDHEQASYWRTLPDLDHTPSFPTGLQTLKDVITAPNTLMRRFAHVAIVENIDQALSLQASLKAGQRLVSKEGGLWRWDGFIVAAGAPTQAALRLKQKNRLSELRVLWEEERVRHEACEQNLEQAKEFETLCIAQDKELREQRNRHQSDAQDIQAKLNQYQAQRERQENKVIALNEQIIENQAELEEAHENLLIVLENLEELQNGDDLHLKLEATRAELNNRRAYLLECQSALERIIREGESRQKRLIHIAEEIQNWQKRSERAARHVEELHLRQEQLQDQLEALNEAPLEIEEKRQTLGDEIEKAEESRKTAADNLIEAENRLRDVDAHARQAEKELAQCREERVRFEAHVQQGKQLCMTIAERVREQLDCKVDDLVEVGEISENAELPDLDAAEKSVDRLHRERDGMGPVNLRAEKELETLSEQITTMTTERSDLLQAIDKLRQGINELNREGRERLLSSFHEVNQHFQDLFRRLFGGGEAHLELIEADDPLQAGLEILASPPGKRMQILSLLSGGEQALTALALLFGVFLTNPAPICVLDEVDAPLDDANVDRFCTMLEEISKNGATRFLVITHHRMTMARMHRLFGVTMSERGVSQLVSVDLQRAAQMVES